MLESYSLCGGLPAREVTSPEYVKKKIKEKPLPYVQEIKKYVTIFGE